MSKDIAAVADGGDGEDEDGPLQILYLSIEERADGFFWRIRSHLQPQPIDVGRSIFPTLDLARRDGVQTLDRVCAQFRRQRASRHGHMIG